ncbi:MAG: sortase [Anaerolineae bacterium]|nr:sortase [Anaerolineae bacterium]
MRDKRPVDELSIEELERILTIKKREQRQQKMARMQRYGRVLDTAPQESSPANHQTAAKQHPSPSAIMAAATAGTAAPEPAVSRPVSQATTPYFEDAPEEVVDRDPDKDRFWKGFLNKGLLLVEVAAVIGVAYLGYMMFQSIGTLERETAAAQQQANEQRLAALPTIAPTPVLRVEQYVLPGGHTPPTAPGGAQFNLNEVPENLLPVVQAQVFPEIIRRPPQTPETALRLIVPKLNLNQSIVQGTDWEALKQGVGQLQNGVKPGDDTGNLVLNAHNDIYGELFRYLDQLEAGDRFQVQTMTQTFTYEITGWEQVEPTDVYVLENQGRATATLISCYPYQVDDKRIVVFANRIDT